MELSAQQIIDCSWGSGNHGCRGGWYNKALSWVYMNGVAEAKNYGPYLAQVRLETGKRTYEDHNSAGMRLHSFDNP